MVFENPIARIANEVTEVSRELSAYQSITLSMARLMNLPHLRDEQREFYKSEYLKYSALADEYSRKNYTLEMQKQSYERSELRSRHE